MFQWLWDDTKYQHFLFNPFITKLHSIKIVFGCDGLNALPTFCGRILQRQTFAGKFSNSHQNLLWGKYSIQKLTIFGVYFCGKVDIIFELYACHISCSVLHMRWICTASNARVKTFWLLRKNSTSGKREAMAKERESEGKPWNMRRSSNRFGRLHREKGRKLLNLNFITMKWHVTCRECMFVQMLQAV